MSDTFSVEVTASKVHNRKIFARVVKIAFLLLLFLIAILYFFLYILYQKGNFQVTLDKNLKDDKNVFLSEDGSFEHKLKELTGESLEYMDNISEHWISETVDTEATGSHNGTNYFAYTFYVVNGGTQDVNYWYEIDIDDTIKNVDSAVRIMIYHNGEKKIYAKRNGTTKQPEEGTIPFHSKSIAVLEERKDFKKGEKDRITLVVWLEGNDPDCINDILGGELKMHMDFTEEHVLKK